MLASVAALTLLVGGVVGGHASAATVLNAGGGSGCGASCFNNQGTYSFTFSASDFSGPVDISKLLMGRSVLGNLDSHFFSMNFLLNGQKVGSWGQWNMSGVGGDDLSFSGADLLWNPADGDLVLVLELVAPNGEKLLSDGAGGWYVGSGGGGGGGGGGRAAPGLDDPGSDPGSDEGGGFTSFFSFSDDQSDDQGDGGQPPPGNFLRTSGSVPEPATWALMVGGFGFAGAALRRRRSHRAVAG